MWGFLVEVKCKIYLLIKSQCTVIHNYNSRKKGVDKIFKFDPKNPPPKRKKFVYLISTNLLTFKNVLDQISAYYGQSSSEIPDYGTKQYHVIVFPKLMTTFEELLEEEGLFGIVELYKFNWDFILLDNGVMSLEIPNIYEETFVKNDTSLLSSIAHSFRLFNMVMKRPNFVFTFGENSENILNMVHRMENFQKKSEKDESKDTPDFNGLIIIDRSKDYASCLLTPVVYSGLLLEIYKYNSGTLQIEPETKIQSGKLKFIQKESEGTSDKKVESGHLRMNGGHDQIYSENRYRHFSEVISLLTIQTKNLGIEGKMYSKDMKLSEMKDYVANKLPKVAAQKKELFKHLILCEKIMNEIGGNFEKHQTVEENILTNNNRKQIMAYIDELLSTDAHKFNSLRLICLYHITIGLTNDEASKFMTNYLNAFGYQYLSIFMNLFTAKLFPDTLNLASKPKKLSSISLPILKSQFQIEANKLKLLPTDVPENVRSEASKVCPSFVFNGNYIPLIAQLANIIFTVNNFDDLNMKLGHLEQLKMTGKVFDNMPPKTIRELSISNFKKDVNFMMPLKPRTLFIFVVGGLSYAEIAACNLIERMTSSKIVVASNAIISGSDFIENIVKSC